jgi:hypothetical protein
MLHVFPVFGSEGSTSPMYLRLQCLHSVGKLLSMLRI